MTSEASTSCIGEHFSRTRTVYIRCRLHCCQDLYRSSNEVRSIHRRGPDLEVDF
jgi:hypothetical protein